MFLIGFNFQGRQHEQWLHGRTKDGARKKPGSHRLSFRSMNLALKFSGGLFGAVGPCGRHGAVVIDSCIYLSKPQHHVLLVYPFSGVQK